MSIVEVVSMAMAKLLVVLFEDEKAMRQDIQLCLLVVEKRSTWKNKHNCFVERNPLIGCRDDSRHVDQGSPC